MMDTVRAPVVILDYQGLACRTWEPFASMWKSRTRATDDVVFGEPGDLVLLGARSLEGLNVRVEPREKRLVDAGPAPAASAA